MHSRRPVHTTQIRSTLPERAATARAPPSLRRGHDADADRGRDRRLADAGFADLAARARPAARDHATGQRAQEKALTPRARRPEAHDWGIHSYRAGAATAVSRLSFLGAATQRRSRTTHACLRSACDECPTDRRAGLR